MGKLLISCPNTGRNVFTGKHVDPLRFRKSAVFFGRTYCEHCESVHEWLARGGVESAPWTVLRDKFANADLTR